MRKRPDEHKPLAIPLLSLPLSLIALVAIGTFMTGWAVGPTSATQALGYLRTAQAVELVSLEPIHDGTPQPQLYREQVLGSVRLDAAGSRVAASAIHKAIAASNGDVAGCFEPRHLLRVERKGHRYDFLICYGCAQLYIYDDGRFLNMIPVGGSSAELNGLLEAAHVPVSHSDERPEEAAA